MIERDQREGQESPKDECVGQAGERALANDFGLAEDFPEEIPDALAEGKKLEVGIFFRGEDLAQHHAEAAPKEIAGGGGHRREEELLNQGEVLGFAKDRERKRHRRAEMLYRATIQDQAGSCRSSVGESDLFSGLVVSWRRQYRL